MNLEEYLSKYIIRYDKDKLLPYFEPKDYQGLLMNNFSFTYKENTLNGGYFYYPCYKKNELVIFVNGIGSGYVTYMTEIERIAKAGYKVLSIDNMGDFTSEGDNIHSLAEALAILDSLLNHLSSFAWYKNTKIKLVGHSLGGYAVSNIMNFHPEIKALVAISGFVSVDSFLKSLGANEEVLDYEAKANPKYACSNAIDAIKDKDIPMLFIHSIDDQIVSYQNNFMYLKENVSKENICFMSVNQKGHNPDYTIDGVKYMKEKFEKLFSLKGDEAIEFSHTIDFKRITKLDEEVFEKIIDTLNKN